MALSVGCPHNLMTSKYNKTIVLVSLFVIVLAVGIFIKTDAGRGYISWLRATASNIVGMNVEAPTEGKIADNIDYSSININSPNQDKNASEPAEQPVQVENPVITAKPADVEATIMDISVKVAEISTEVKEITVNAEIQKQIDQIALQIDKIGQDVNILRTNAQISQIQQQIDVLSQQVSLLSQQLSISA